MTHLLQGLRVLNTRPREQAHALSEQIRAAGAIAIELPALEIQAQGDWVKQLPDLNQVNQAVFISANAVHHCFSQLKYWPSTIKVLAIGQSTAAALSKFNILVDATPEQPDSEHLLRLPYLQQVEGHSILLFKGEGGRPLIEETLKERGAQVLALNVYQRVLPKINSQFIKSIWRDDLVDIILLTSEQSMHHLFKLFQKDTHNWLRNKPCLVLSKRLAQAAASMGIKNIILSHPEEVMNTLFDYYQGLTYGQQ